jgi:hypothetical protein
MRLLTGEVWTVISKTELCGEFRDSTGVGTKAEFKKK